MADIENHEYQLLDAIAQDPLVTQARLSSNLGIAIGSVNWYIKRLINRGYVKVSRLDRTRLKYDLTADGMAVLTQRAFLYMKDSLKIYTGVRSKAKTIVKFLRANGIQRVYLDGDDEMMDIFRLTCLEAGIGFDSEPKRIIVSFNGQNIRVEDSETELTHTISALLDEQVMRS